MNHQLTFLAYLSSLCFNLWKLSFVYVTYQLCSMQLIISRLWGLLFEIKQTRYILVSILCCCLFTKKVEWMYGAWSCKAQCRWGKRNAGNQCAILVCPCTNACVGVSQVFFWSFIIIAFDLGLCKMCHEGFFLSRQAGKLIQQHIWSLSLEFMRLGEVS